MKRKLISLLLAALLTLGAYGAPVMAKDATEDDNVAYAIMGENTKTRNFSVFKVGAQADVKQISERAGEPCWIIDKANGLQSDKLCMVLDNDFKAGIDQGDAFLVEVDYFDVAKGGFFFLAYDGQRPRQEREYYCKSGETVYTQGTNQWKTATFRIDDAKFQKSLEGSCDLFVGTRLSDALNNADYLSEIPIPFKAVRITKIPGANPVRNIVSIDQFGNAFPYYQESKIIHNTFTNLLKEPTDFQVTYELENADGYVGYSQTETIHFEANEQKKIDFDFGECERCDRYNYFVTVENKDLGVYSRVQYSVVAIMKSDPDGILNEHLFFCGPGYNQQSLTTLDSAGHALDLLKLSGASGSRYDETWGNREASVGAFRTNLKQDEFLAELKKRGLSPLPITYLGNNAVTGAWNIMPDTPEKVALAGEYLDRYVKYLADKTDVYEAWNEPDLTGFARNFTPETYMNLYSILAEKVKAYDPTAKIGYLCYAGASGQMQKDYTTAMLEMGLADMVRGNAITFHGYPPMPVEKGGSEGKIQWYVDEMQKYGLSRDDYEIWVTEFGGTVADHGGSRRQQGAATIREILQTRMAVDADRFYIYRFEDPGNLTYRREASFGEVSSSNGYARIYGQICVPWESFLMTTAYNYLFANSEPVRYLEKSDERRVSLFRSNKFEKDLIAMHALEGTDTVTLSLGAKEISYFDEYGNERKLTSEDGVYTFGITEYTTYLMGDFTDPKEVEGENRFETTGTIEAVSMDTIKITVANHTDRTYTAEIEAVGENSNTIKFTLNPGLNEFTVDNSAEVGKGYELRAIIKDGDRVVSVLPIEIKSVNIAVTQMSLELKSPNNFNKWNGVVRISNSSAERVLKGIFEVTAPEKFKTKVPVNVTFVPRQKTAEISFELPEITQKQIYTFEYQLVLDSGEVIQGTALADTTCAAYASQTPTIDGVMAQGEWNEQTLMQTGKLEDVVYVQTWAGKPWQGASDQSAKAYAMWDEENVYFCWDVTDDVFSQEYDGFYTWQGDSVQFGVYMGEGDEYIALGEANQAFTEIGIAQTPNGPEVYRFSAQDSTKHKSGLMQKDDYELAIKVDGNHAVYELSMKWDSLLPDGVQPKANSRLGFSFLVNDNDGQGRRGAVLFAGGIFFNKDSSQFTYINLIGKN